MSKTTTDNTYVDLPSDQICLPLGKAFAILDLFVPDLPLTLANAGYAAMDLIREAEDIAQAATNMANDPEKTNKAGLNFADSCKSVQIAHIDQLNDAIGKATGIVCGLRGNDQFAGMTRNVLADSLAAVTDYLDTLAATMAEIVKLK